MSGEPRASEPAEPDVVRAVRARSPGLSLRTDEETAVAHARDQTALLEAGRPAAVAFPRSTAEVASLLEAASEHGTPVVTRGAGSGLAGGANAIDGCLVACLTQMDRILEVDHADRVAVVEPGVITGALKARAAAAGLWYPPDPASYAYSTVGGNVATNAGGLCCVGLGVTGDFVLGLEVVLADGTVIETGGRTRKRVAGYDLTRLFVGSEGTLGIVTRVTVRLLPPPLPPSTIVASFPDTTTAGVAVQRILARIVPRALEIMDRTTIRAVEDWQSVGLDPDAGAVLLIQTEAPEREGAGDAGLVTEICADAGADPVVPSGDPAEAELLMTARRLAYPALERLGVALLDDVAVPVSRVPELLGAIEAVSRDRSVLIGTFGHAADGNMHPTIVIDRGDEASAARARLAFTDVLAAALRLGGTIAGEHGIGALKQRYLEADVGAAAGAVQRAIKHALDPLGILNPGKGI